MLKGPSLFPLVQIIKRPDMLIILDYRPTFFMFLAMAAFLIFLVAFVLFFTRVYEVDSFAVWSALILTVISLGVSLRGTIREAYTFDKASDSYSFVRQFIYKKEVIEGGLSQFRGLRVHTIIGRDDDGHRRTSHVVNLLQDGMLLGASTEQTIRPERPILNFYSVETRIASAIASFLNVKLIETHD